MKIVSFKCHSAPKSQRPLQFLAGLGLSAQHRLGQHADGGLMLQLAGGEQQPCQLRSPSVIIFGVVGGENVRVMPGQQCAVELPEQPVFSVRIKPGIVRHPICQLEPVGIRSRLEQNQRCIIVGVPCRLGHKCFDCHRIDYAISQKIV